MGDLDVVVDVVHALHVDVVHAVHVDVVVNAHMALRESPIGQRRQESTTPARGGHWYVKTGFARMRRGPLYQQWVDRALRTFINVCGLGLGLCRFMGTVRKIESVGSASS